MRLKNFILLFAFCTTLYGRAEYNMYVQLSSGEIMYYALEKQPSITYSDDALTITTQLGSTNAIPLNSIKKILYDYPGITDITDMLFLEGPIDIYSITGNHITTIETLSYFNHLNIPTGVYIIRHGNFSHKVLKK